MNATYFKICKKYYEKGIYDKEQLLVFVASGKLTQEEYDEIVGE